MSHWKEQRLKYLASVPIANGLGEKGEFDDPAWPRYIRTTDIAGPSELRGDTFKSLPPTVAERAMLTAGDILMTAAGATIGKSFTFKESYPACYAGYLVRFRPDGDVADGRFIAYWMQSAEYWAQIDAQRVKSTIENFSASRYQNLKLRVPPLAIQRTIADYLDTETARIDALIEKKRRLWFLLGSSLVARIEALICQPSARLIPLRRLLLELPQYGASETGEDGLLDWPRYIRITDLDESGGLRDDEVLRLPPTVARPFLLLDGDVLVARSGATVGKAFIYRQAMGPSCFAGYLIRLRFNPALMIPTLVSVWTKTGHYWGSNPVSVVAGHHREC